MEKQRNEGEIIKNNDNMYDSNTKKQDKRFNSICFQPDIVSLLLLENYIWLYIIERYGSVQYQVHIYLSWNV